MNIDRIEFLAWMERIMERFDLMSNHIIDLQKKRASIDGEELLDNQDLLQMLKISNRSFNATALVADFHITQLVASYTTRCLTCISL